MRRIDPGARPRSRAELAAWYSAVLDAQSASGLSVAQYAGRIGVSIPTLYSGVDGCVKPRDSGGLGGGHDPHRGEDHRDGSRRLEAEAA